MTALTFKTSKKCLCKRAVSNVSPARGMFNIFFLAFYLFIYYYYYLFYIRLRSFLLYRIVMTVSVYAASRLKFFLLMSCKHVWSRIPSSASAPATGVRRLWHRMRVHVSDGLLWHALGRWPGPHWSRQYFVAGWYENRQMMSWDMCARGTWWSLHMLMWLPHQKESGIPTTANSSTCGACKVLLLGSLGSLWAGLTDVSRFVSRRHTDIHNSTNVVVARRGSCLKFFLVVTLLKRNIFSRAPTYRLRFHALQLLTNCCRITRMNFVYLSCEEKSRTFALHDS
jgi:hypothetical protein